MKKLNSLILQYDIILKDISANIKTINNLLFQIPSSQKDNLDIIIFPEMSLTGYNFKSKQDIDSFCDDTYDKEEIYSQKTLSFGSELSKKYSSYVLIGFPEKSNLNYYNSVYLINREGKIESIIRKTFLYETDYKWASEGDSFKTIELISRKGDKIKVALGICMDINPYDFKSDFNEYEFGNFCLKQNVDMVILVANWLLNSSNKDKEIVIEAINYWLYRLYPILYNENIYFCVSNRIGEEVGVRFTGCSCIVKLGKNIKLLKNLDYKEEGILIKELFWKKGL